MLNWEGTAQTHKIWLTWATSLCSWTCPEASSRICLRRSSVSDAGRQSAVNSHQVKREAQGEFKKQEISWRDKKKKRKKPYLYYADVEIIVAATAIRWLQFRLRGEANLWRPTPPPQTPTLSPPPFTGSKRNKTKNEALKTSATQLEWELPPPPPVLYPTFFRASKPAS